MHWDETHDQAGIHSYLRSADAWTDFTNHLIKLEYYPEEPNKVVYRATGHAISPTMAKKRD